MKDYYEVKKRGMYPKAIIYEEKVVIFKKNKEIEIPIEEIERIDYAKPTLINYLFSIPCWFGGICPGRLEIYLKKKIDKTRLYILKIRQNEIPKLPKFFKVAIGYINRWDE